MDNGKQDRRKKYTRMVLKQALLELMVDADISRISIKDICDRADINRGTFYAHYKDPHDLLEQIEMELFEEIGRALESEGEDGSLVNKESSERIVRAIFRVLERNGELCRILLGDHGDREFLEKVLYLAHDRCVDEWTRGPSPKDSCNIEYLFTFIANGSIGIIQLWVQGGMREPADEIASLINDLTERGVRSLL